MSRRYFPKIASRYNETMIMICSLGYDDKEDGEEMINRLIQEEGEKWVFFATVLETFHMNAPAMLSDQPHLPFTHPIIIRDKIKIFDLEAERVGIINNWSHLEHNEVFKPDLVETRRQN